MSVLTLTSVEEYLSTLYRPDCDLVDGALIERNVGQKDHSKLQGEVRMVPGAPSAASPHRIP